MYNNQPLNPDVMNDATAIILQAEQDLYGYTKERDDKINDLIKESVNTKLQRMGTETMEEKIICEVRKMLHDGKITISRIFRR